MRDEVFRIPGTAGSRGRTVELDGEVWWLLSDVLSLRGHSRQLARLPELLSQLSEEDAECVWVLEPGLTRPSPRWVVNEQGRRIVHDLYPQKQGRKRRTAPPGASSRRPPGFQPLPTED